jgi:rhodanese-related sulfurtransferase
MTKALKIGYDALIEAARREIDEMNPEELLSLRDRGAATDICLIDVRDVREIERDGTIPGAFHCPRGMLEFWIDPASPYFKATFGENKRFVFYCALDWRSALATQTAQNMGLRNVAHLKGGFKAWKDLGGEVEIPATRPKL